MKNPRLLSQASRHVLQAAEVRLNKICLLISFSILSLFYQIFNITTAVKVHRQPATSSALRQNCSEGTVISACLTS